jgi:BirA family biotin operon repressor/biotin-[acetyl-CoA-carboxylase] ligase
MAETLLVTEPALNWDAPALRAQLAPHLPGLSVDVVKRAASTNTALLERARMVHLPEVDEGASVIVRRSVESRAFAPRAADALPCLLVAEQQTGGRGRQGRVWHSAPRASLTLSLALPLQPADWSGLSLAVGTALADALDPGRRIGLKWPNDLWLMDGAAHGRKLGGILIETVAAGAHRVAVIGIGLNVLPMELDEAATGYAALHELDAGATAPGMLHRVALPLVLALRRFEHEGFAAFTERYAARDLLLGRSVQTTQADAREGIAHGVSAQGALRVQTAAGLRHVIGGEVSVRLDPAGGPGAAHEAEPAALSARPTC